MFLFHLTDSMLLDRKIDANILLLLLLFVFYVFFSHEGVSHVRIATTWRGT